MEKDSNNPDSMDGSLRQTRGIKAEKLISVGGWARRGGQGRINGGTANVAKRATWLAWLLPPPPPQLEAYHEICPDDPRAPEKNYILSCSPHTCLLCSQMKDAGDTFATEFPYEAGRGGSGEKRPRGNLCEKDRENGGGWRDREESRFRASLPPDLRREIARQKASQKGDLIDGVEHGHRRAEGGGRGQNFFVGLLSTRNSCQHATATAAAAFPSPLEEGVGSAGGRRQSGWKAQNKVQGDDGVGKRREEGFLSTGGDEEKS
ncbi:hypothetical protein WN55_04972 [Dufourea novaeangliae]|uniref:Uncharacterized protein n=1 Tax=Dufourea novaeangliae TaxID=178035 RepID=A0A154PNK4_DUFNO|nr:hypothetical protein WN55_04972 [Dufourea novaeangliae]